ncbi:MAG: LamG-like jellyroll fold domain-containing protein [Spirochaetales bacterium]
MSRVWVFAGLVFVLLGLAACLGPTDPGAGDGLGGDGGGSEDGVEPTEFRMPSLVHELLFDNPSDVYRNTAVGAPDAIDRYGNASPSSHADRFGFPTGGLTMNGEPLALPVSDRNHPSASGMTISFWARLSNLHATAAEVLLSTVVTNSPTTDGWQLIYLPSSDSYAFRVGHATENIEVMLTVPESVASRWHHVGIVWDRTVSPPEITFLVNGIYSITETLPDDAYTPTVGDMTIGVNANQYPFDGELDQLRIYDSPLPLDDPNAALDVRRLRDEGKRIFYASAPGGAAAIYASRMDGSDAELFSSPSTTTGDAIRDIEVRPDLGYVYWTNIGTDRVERAPISGGPVETVFDAAASADYLARATNALIRGIALSADGDTLYAADQNYDGILAVDLTTGTVSNVYQPQPRQSLTLLDVDLDAANDRLYFLEEDTAGVNTYALMTIGTNGSSHGTLIENSEGSGEPQPAGLALDVANDRVFFASRVGKTYAASNLNAVTPTITEVGDTSAIFNIGLSYSPSDDALYMPRESFSFSAGDLQSFVVETGLITNYAGVDAGYALDLLVPRE